MLDVMGCKSKGSPETINRSTMVEGILITGGLGAETSTDLYLVGENKTCTLPPLPDVRFSHAMGVVDDTPVICGGSKLKYAIDTATAITCLHFTPSTTNGVWTEYVNLSCPRTNPTGWVSKEGLVVFGGGNCFSAEVIPSGGSYSISPNKAYSCNIDDDLSTIITGGINSHDVIERYSSTGKVETLPKLNTGRWGHGCGSYHGSDGRMILIVAGGADKKYNELSSTEKLIIGEKAWTMVKPLPYVLQNMGSISMLDKVFFIGGRTVDGESAKIIEFDGEDWLETSQLPLAREDHAVAKVDATNFLGFCK